MSEESIAERLDAVMNAINAAARRAGRDPAAVQLIAVSKSQPVEAMQEYLEAAAKAGVAPVFGENYVQEFKSKREIVGPVPTHMIGPLQSNKARDAVALFSMVQSVHSESILSALNREAAKAARTLEVMLQVNISLDEGKKGFSPEEIRSEKLWNLVKSSSNLDVRGLMTITRFYDEPEAARRDYRNLRLLSEELKGTGMIGDGLSMGMSGDFEVAVEEGATLVRIGTLLFETRD